MFILNAKYMLFSQIILFDVCHAPNSGISHNRDLKCKTYLNHAKNKIKCIYQLGSHNLSSNMKFFD